VQDLIEDLEVGGCMDRHLQDQVIVFMALAAGQSVLKCGPLELHTKTAIRFAALLTGAKFEVLRVADPVASDRLSALGYVDEESDVPNTTLVCCEGIGLQNRHADLDTRARVSKYLAGKLGEHAHTPGSLARPTEELLAELKAAGVDTDGHHESRRQHKYAHGGGKGRRRRGGGGKQRQP
jgi:RNA 3'-terminal phosphate cyclase